MSISELARRTDIHRTTLVRWEAGLACPSAVILETVLSVLEVPHTERRRLWQQLGTPAALARVRQVTSNTDASPLACGDLLRALRLRAGQTQVEAARLAGITQGLLARWENNAALPDAQRLHSLCYVLGASGDEVAELTASRLSPQEPLPTDDAALAFSFSRLAHSSRTPNKSLGLLAHAAQFSRLIRNGYSPAQRQTEVWARQAHYAQRSGEAPETIRAMGERALATTARSTIFTGHIAAGVVAVANARARMEGPDAGVRYLGDWVERVVSPVYRAWLESCRAQYLMDAGNTDAALKTASMAYEETRVRADQFPGDFVARSLDYAEFLLLVGKPAQALAILNTCDLMPREGGAAERCLKALLLSEISQQLGECGQAVYWLANAQILAQEPDVPYQSRVTRLARLLEQ